MKTKRAIVYLRISNDRQSNYSIEGQRMHVTGWCERNFVEVVDIFVDEGYSARNFDRPDYQRLNKFIQQHYRTVDYLAINSFDRFSRDAGEAIVAIKKLQRQYAIKVVSVTEGVTFDADDPGSFFYAGLMLLKGEDEIIRNRSRINLGIYTAKKKEGRYLGASPIGYKNVRDEMNKPIIVPDPENAPIVKFIFKAFLTGAPIQEIIRQARLLGFKQTGNSVINKILANPVYAGLIHVKAYKDYPEEIVEGRHAPLVDRHSWYEVQDRLKGRNRSSQIIINEELPLRSVLLCHCGKPLSGAPSKGKMGKYYYYYKCLVSSKHNNISAIRANAQMEDIFQYLSLPETLVNEVIHSSEKMILERNQYAKNNRQKFLNQLEDVEDKLKSIEEKYIANQLAFDSYHRWFSDLTNQRSSLNAQIDNLNNNQDEIYKLLQTELHCLTDMKKIYQEASVIEKQELVRLVFDRTLYYADGAYRTRSLNNLFMCNEKKMSENGLLFIDKKKGNSNEFPSGGAGGP